MGKEKVELRQAGEWTLIRRLRRRFSKRHPSILIGPGDDAALVQLSPRRKILITTDLLVEGIDFDLKFCALDQVGHKAMAANLSDIAAMGGIPRYALVAIALPAYTHLESVDRLYHGMMRLARKHKVRLIGGDTSSSPQGIMVAVSLIGEVEPALAVKRSGARPGDRIFVTGPLGDSNAGLEILKSGNVDPSSEAITERNKEAAALIKRHLLPQPRVREGRLLAVRRLASAMIDLSDGLATDLRHLCRASGVGARIDLDRLPVSKALSAYAEQRGRDPKAYALEGGEEFELLFAVRPARLRELDRLSSTSRLKIHPLGEITKKNRGLVVVDRRGDSRPLPSVGYEHFR